MIDTTAPPNVFLFHIAPAPDLAPDEIARGLVARTAGFELASRPYLDPALFSHRVLRGAAGELAWQIAFDGLDLPPDGLAPAGGLGEALAAEVRARLVGLGALTSSASYTDLSTPAPGLGFGREGVDAGGAVVFADGDAPCWEDHAADSGAPEAGAELSADLLAEIERIRAATPPEPGLKKWGKGHMYGGGGDRAHVAYVASTLDARASRASFADRRRILAFRAFQAREGSTAAINTYDNQIVTWGTGWGGLGWMGKVMSRVVANGEARERLGRAGLRYRGKNVYDVVDLHSKRVVTGTREALEVMRGSVPLLYLLIDLARDPATRDAVTEAQLLTFMEGSGNISGADAVATQALFNLIAHLKHWAPGYVIGCLEWAAPQAGEGPPSVDRDRRLAALVGRYFYGKARKFKWIPSWKQFQLYWQHMKEDGLDCLGDPFIQAASHPEEDPFAGDSAPGAAKAARAATAAEPARARAALSNAPLAGEAELDRAAAGQGALRRGARGAGVKALQEALIALGLAVPGGADGIFGAGLEDAVKAFQSAQGLGADGIVGAGTLRVLDEKLGAGGARKA